MTLISRAYEHPDDFNRLITFLSHARSAIHEAHYLHTGDLTWQIYHMLATYRPADLVQIWEDPSVGILGFVLLYPAFGSFDVQIDPHYRGEDLEDEMVAWAEQHLPSAGTVYTLVHHQDSRRQTLLVEHGYHPGGEWLYIERLLNDHLPPSLLTFGFTLRNVAGDSDAFARATVLAAAFDAPPQPELYRQFMHAPGYVADLDIVVIAPDQRFAAFAMGWIDPLARVGQFEPVGTAPEFRRRGLAQAVLYEGMRRMQHYGMERAIVIVEAAEEAACQLYEAVGFEKRWGLTLYSKNRIQMAYSMPGTA